MLCFGLTKGPATFQNVMNRLFAGMRAFVVVYLDNSLIFSDRSKHLDAFLSLLEANDVYANPSSISQRSSIWGTLLAVKASSWMQES